MSLIINLYRLYCVLRFEEIVKPKYLYKLLKFIVIFFYKHLVYKMTLSNTLIIIQGPTKYKTDVFRTYKDYPNVIWSTLDNEKIESLHTNIIMLYNKIPKHRGYTNVNLQTLTSKAGCEYAREHGFKYCLKVRSDIVITDPVKLINLLEKRCKIENRIYTVAYQKNPRTGFLHVDYVVFGEVDRMCDFWDYNELSYVTHPAEMKIMRKYLRKYAPELDIPTINDRKHEITVDQLKKYYGFFLQDIVDAKIDIIWIGRKDKRYKYPHRDGVYVNLYTDDKWYGF
jgi:hypothetical protein